MATITERILQSTGLASAIGSILAREFGLTSDTERPVIGTSGGGAKYIGTEEVLSVTTTSPAAVSLLRRSRTVILVDTDAAGGNVALDIRSGAQVAGYKVEVICLGAYKVTVTYATGITLDVKGGFSASWVWNGSAWKTYLGTVPTAGLWYSSSGVGGSDGNGGQPPAPKPRNSAGNNGHWQYVATTLPATGTFATISFKSGLFFACDADVPGGTNMNTFYGTTGIGAVAYWRTA